MNDFENKLHEERLRVGELCSGIMHQFLQSMKEIDERLPECPDVEEKWEQIANAYVSCLHQLYLFGAALQFFDERSGKAERNRMGYHMTKMN